MLKLKTVQLKRKQLNLNPNTNTVSLVDTIQMLGFEYQINLTKPEAEHLC